MPRTFEYRQFYFHLKKNHPYWQPMEETENFLIILVDARHLDYTDGSKFFQSVTKHPSDGSKNGDVGHVWIYLQGKIDGKEVKIEGGHSGEIDEYPARYFQGLMNYHDCGYANPTEEQLLYPCYEANPIKYLWSIRDDGFFQKGSGGHSPTFAAKFSLTQEQLKKILRFIHPRHFPYQDYSLIGPQCCTFAERVASLADIQLTSKMTMKISQKVSIGGKSIRLWEDPKYSTLTFATPDLMERSLMEAVENGEAEYALNWYKQRKKLNPKARRQKY